MALTEVAGRRMTAEIDGDFVVFLIGARFNNKLHMLRSVLDLGGRRGMKHMLDYLVSQPEKGLLAYEMGIPTIVQYWRSFEHLEAFARDKEDPHLEVWRQYWRRVGKSERTGMWHESDLVNVFLYDGAMVPDPYGIITSGHDNETARTVAIRQGEAINASALTEILRAIVANNRAGGWRRLKRETG